MFLTFFRGRLIGNESCKSAQESYLAAIGILRGFDPSSYSESITDNVLGVWVEEMIIHRQVHLNDDKGRLLDQYFVDQMPFDDDTLIDLLDQMSWEDLNG